MNSSSRTLKLLYALHCCWEAEQQGSCTLFMGNIFLYTTAAGRCFSGTLCICEEVLIIRTWGCMIENPEMFSFHELLLLDCSGLIARWLLKIIQPCLFSTWFTLCKPSLIRLGFWYQAKINQFPFSAICWACTSSRKETLEYSHRITSQPNNVYFYLSESFSYFKEFPKQEKSIRFNTELQKFN